MIEEKDIETYLYISPNEFWIYLFDKKNLNFNFHHLTSSNSTFIDKEFEENKKSFLEFKNYKSFFKKIDIIVDHNERKKLIEKKFMIYA